MKVDRRVQGVVRDETGAPVPNALVEMVSTRPGLKSWEQPILLSVSDEQGGYIVDGIPPGEYYLGVNIKSTPTKEHPYPRVYYPGTTDIKGAVTISVGVGAAAHDYDLHVPGKLSLVRIQGRVVKADGTPPSPQDRVRVRIKERGLSGQIEQEEIGIDTEGRFQFELCDGIGYTAFAFSGPNGKQIYSAPIEFVPTKDKNRLDLILDKALDEFSRLRDKRSNQ